MAVAAAASLVAMMAVTRIDPAAMDSVMSDASTPSSWAARPWRKASCADVSKEAMVASRVMPMETAVLGGGGDGRGEGDGGGGEGNGGGEGGGSGGDGEFGGRVSAGSSV